MYTSRISSYTAIPGLFPETSDVLTPTSRYLSKYALVPKTASLSVYGVPSRSGVSAVDGRIGNDVQLESMAFALVFDCELLCSISVPLRGALEQTIKNWVLFYRLLLTQ